MKFRVQSKRVLVGVFWLTGFAVALGCSVGIGYVKPTNYELVKGARAVVLAEAVAFEKKEAFRYGRAAIGTFEFKVLERIKGDFAERMLKVEGDTDHRTWGAPDDFSYTKPDHGPCNPTDYKVGAKYVLLLNYHEYRGKGGWHVGGPPFTRINVEVPDATAPWVEAVRRYARVASLQNYEEEKKELGRMKAVADKSDDGLSKAIAKDIEAHFKQPTTAKSAADLKALFDKAPNVESKAAALWACSGGKKKEAGPWIIELVRAGKLREFPHSLAACVSALRLVECRDEMAQAFFAATDEHERRIQLYSLLELCTKADEKLVMRAFDKLDVEEARPVAEWFTTNASPAAIERCHQLVGGKFEEHWHLTFALAAMGDKRVVDWAVNLSKKATEKRWMAYYTFAHSPRPETEALIHEVIRQGTQEALIWLAQGFNDSRIPKRMTFLMEIAKLPNKSPKLVYWLHRTLEEFGDAGSADAELILKLLPPPTEDEPK